MNQCECLLTMTTGNILFFKYLYNTANNLPVNNDFLDNPDYLKGSRVSMISLLLLSIKEDLINDNFDSLVLDDDIKLAIDQVRNKVSNYSFKNDGELISLIRNKLGHGEFDIDFSGNKVVIHANGTDLIININALANMVILLSRAYLRCINEASYKKELSVFNIGVNERINSEYDISKVIENANTIKINLKRLDGKTIDISVYNLVNNYLELLKETNNINLLDKLKNTIITDYPGYQFDYEITNVDIKKSERREISHNLLATYNHFDDLNNRNKLLVIDNVLTTYLRKEEMTFNALASAQSALMIMQAIQKTKSLDKSVIDNFISDTYGMPIIINQNVLGMSLISVFESSFAYGKDNLLKDMDYSMFDFDKIKPTVINLSNLTAPINDQIAAVDKQLSSIMEKKKNLLINKSKVSSDNLKAISSIDKNVNSCDEIINELNNTKIELNKKLAYLGSASFQKHDYNKAIVDGIRNSISHAHHELNDSTTLGTCEFEFHDIYEGATTFDVKVSLEDFYNVLETNTYILGKYLDQEVEKYNLKLKVNN